MRRKVWLFGLQVLWFIGLVFIPLHGLRVLAFLICTSPLFFELVIEDTSRYLDNMCQYCLNSAVQMGSIWCVEGITTSGLNLIQMIGGFFMGVHLSLCAIYHHLGTDYIEFI